MTYIIKNGSLVEISPRDQIEKWIAHWNKGELAACGEMFSEQIVFEATCLFNIIPMSQGKLRSRTTLENFLVILKRIYPNRLYELKQFLDVNGKSMVQLLNIEDSELHLSSFTMDAQGKFTEIVLCDS